MLETLGNTGMRGVVITSLLALRQRVWASFSTVRAVHHLWPAWSALIAHCVPSTLEDREEPVVFITGQLHTTFLKSAVSSSSPLVGANTGNWRPPM